MNMSILERSNRDGSYYKEMVLKTKDGTSVSYSSHGTSISYSSHERRGTPCVYPLHVGTFPVPFSLSHFIIEHIGQLANMCSKFCLNCVGHVPYYLSAGTI